MRPHAHAAILSLALALATGSLGEEVGFVEEFALSPDRQQALAQLVPGSEDAYFYRCLHLQNTGDMKGVETLLAAWIARHGRTGRVEEIQNRQALLRFAEDPEGSRRYLVDRLGLRFDHARQTPDQALALPTVLDPALLAPERLLKEALGRDQTLNGLTPEGLALLLGRDLDPDHQRELLRRLTRPDWEGLPRLVVSDLSRPRSAPFGSLPIHRLLLRSQLDACLALKPDLLNQPAFVEAVLARLSPSPAEDWRQEAESREAYLERLWAFAQRLGPAHNTLKAHVLYHRLAHDRALGTFDRERFMAYLALPRPTHYVPPGFLRRGEPAADLSRDFSPLTGLPAVGNDEPLVRDLLLHVFASEGEYKPFAPYVREDVLKDLFAEAKLVGGSGDVERWVSLLDDPGKLKTLKERVDLSFAPTNRSCYAPGEAVSLDVDVKNVGTLLVKVYALNTVALSRAGKEPSVDIDLDGLPASEERTLALAEPPLRRVRRRIDFPALDRRGAFVVELIGNGRISRALVRKGRFDLLERLGTAGHVFTVVDEAGQSVRDAALWIAGHAYAPGAGGEILVPFTHQPARQDVSVEQGGFACLDRFDHRAEAYALAARIHVDREALLAGNTAPILVRPALSVHGTPVTLSVLEHPLLEIKATTLDGVESVKTVSPFALREDRESEASIQVPDRLARLEVTLRAEVAHLSGDRRETLAATRVFALNGIAATDRTEDLHLARAAEGFVLMVLGRNGEARPGRAIRLALAHRAFTRPVEALLRSDDRGRIVLGTLPGVLRLQATDPAGNVRDWTLPRDQAASGDRLHAAAGQDVRVPYFGTAAAPDRAEFSLLERRGGLPAVDRFDRLALEEGCVVAKGLAPGEYELALKLESRAVLILVGGESRDGWSRAGRHRLELSDASPLQIPSLTADADAVTARILNATKATRLLVVGTRFLPDTTPFDALAGDVPGPRLESAEPALSQYVSDRRIGDEQRYILERRQALKFPGNLLERPSLLLAPWALKETRTEKDAQAGWGERFGATRGAGGGRPNLTTAKGGGPRAQDRPDGGSDLDFLAVPSVVLGNLAPDADGILRIPRKALAGCQTVTILALDRGEAVCRQIALPERPLETRDLRLAKALDPGRHLVERRQASVLKAGERRPVGTGGYAAYDTLGRAYDLLLALSGDEHLKTFRFLLEWPDLKEARKRACYAEHACHELNVFLSRKDPDFFKRVVKPFLENKLEKDFLDAWLLERDLKPWLDSWRFERLNAVERILLARRMPAHREGILRHLKERLELVPADPERWDRLFEAALRSRALEADGKDLAMRDHEESLDEMAVAGEVRALKSEREAGKALMRKKSDGRAPAESPPAPEMAMDRADMAFEARQLYRPVERTKQWAESRYYRLPRAGQGPDLIAIDPFWMDFAERGEAPGFLSPSLPEAAGNFPEMMLALAFLDLPWEGGKAPESAVVQGEFTAQGPLLLFHRALQETEGKAGGAGILVAQNLFRPDDRWRYEGAERMEKFVTGECVAGEVYGSRVVLTNPGASRQKLEVLLQIPQGAIGLMGAAPTRGLTVPLEPYATRALEVHFYFPRPGTFPHYGVRVAKGAALAASAQGEELRVLEKPSRPDATSWEHVSQMGTGEETLAFLEAHNLERLDLARMAWRLREKAFFQSALALLSARRRFDPDIGSYAFLHGDAAGMREYLQHRPDFLARCGERLRSPLVDLDPTALGRYEHLEFSPLVNPRAHPLGGRPGILNVDLLAQYRHLLGALCCQSQPAPDDLMALATYLLVQDRVAEAKACFAKVDPARLETRLQHDYLKAYLAFCDGDPKAARKAAEPYRDYPVDSWKRRFQEVLAQADEIEGRKPVRPAGGGNAREANAREAAGQGVLELEIEQGRTLVLRHKSIAACRLDFYPMDLEILFSKNPFNQGQGADLTVVQPAESVAVKLSRKDLTRAPIPGRFLKVPVLVEAAAEGQRRTAVNYAHAIALEFVETYGQVTVRQRDSGKPLPKAYVKVYARLHNGEVRFYKDGYTDLRGRFDYATVSTDELGQVARFAILVLSEADGGLVREVEPPKP